MSTRVANVNVVTLINNGGQTAIDRGPAGPSEEDYCPQQNPLVGPDSLIITGNPPSSAGRRQLNLYRRGELGVSGTIIRVAWGPESDATFAATYPNVNIRIGHKLAGTSLAQGTLNGQFDVNGFVTKQDYRVPQAFDINGAPPNDGYLDWPTLKSFFEYDGKNDVILDVEAQEGNTFQTFRAFQAISQFFGTCTCTNFFGCAANNSIGLRQGDGIWGGDTYAPGNNPPLGTFNPYPGVNVMQFELANLRSDARSLYYNTNSPDPDYLSPIVNPLVQQGGATVTFTWSASADGIVEDVPFSPNIDDCDGFQFIRFQAVLRANFFTKGRPRVELLEIPFIFP